MFKSFVFILVLIFPVFSFSQVDDSVKNVWSRVDIQSSQDLGEYDIQSLGT